MAQAECSHPDKRFKSDYVFNLINKNFITLKDDDTKAYAVHLKTVLEEFVSQMKTIDPFFAACYQKIAYVGSYYEGLKVGKPEEFDLNVIIKLPINYDSDISIIVAPEKAGYVKIKANADVLDKLRKHVRWSQYKTIDKWFHTPGMYLDQNKFRQWFESVVQKTYSFFQQDGNYIFPSNGQEYKIRHKKSGPALTLKITLPDRSIIDVDLVPALEFAFAPPKPFRSHTAEKKWFAIPKPLTVANDNVLWRPSFYIREQELLKGSVKPVIRQMKKLRDTQNFNIASYYIKILFLRELEEQNYCREFQRRNPTYLFFHMLRKLQQACFNREIRDFWNPENNLLSTIGDVELANNSYRLLKIIKDIEKNIDRDPYIIAKYILFSVELDQLKSC